MSRGLVAGVMLLITLAFQNCTQASHGSSEAASGPLRDVAGTSIYWPGQPGGTGNGYDGKVFVQLKAQGLCADLSQVESAIVIPTLDPQPYLVREACANVTAKSLDASAVSYGPNADSLIYGGQPFTNRMVFETPSPVIAPIEAFRCTDVDQSPLSAAQINLTTINGRYFAQVSQYQYNIKYTSELIAVDRPSNDLYFVSKPPNTNFFYLSIKDTTGLANFSSLMLYGTDGARSTFQAAGSPVHLYCVPVPQ